MAPRPVPPRDPRLPPGGPAWPSARQALTGLRAGAILLAASGLAGLGVMLLGVLADAALAAFQQARQAWAGLPLILAPAGAVAAVAATRRWAPGAAGSGIPQLLATLDPACPARARPGLISLRLSLAKLLITPLGLLGGLSLGREGPAVQLAAGIVQAGRRWMPRRTRLRGRDLAAVGGAAGIAAAFNTPLGGLLFALEQLGRAPGRRPPGLLMASVVVAGLGGLILHGGAPHFGSLPPVPPSVGLILPALALALLGGVLGGGLARLLIHSLDNRGPGPLARWRREHPLRLAAACGLGVALLGLASEGRAYGGGEAWIRELLAGGPARPGLDTLLKALATWLTACTGAPGGLFAPSLALGASLGADLASLLAPADRAAMVALGMAGFLAGLTQAPLTAFVIVMEMVGASSLVFGLMGVAGLASAVSSRLSPPLYPTLAAQLLPGPRPDPAGPASPPPAEAGNPGARA